MTDLESKGFYKLNWVQRCGFASGDLAQNFIFQTVGSFILFYYTNVFILGGNPAESSSKAGTLLLVARLIDVIWDPVVGAFVDKRNPKWGKYRSYLVLGGIPLTCIAILCFWDQFKPSMVYAYLTYIALQMCYTLVNVPYGALNASLTRDTDEITILTSTRMFFANMGGLLVNGGVPVVVNLFAGRPVDMKFVFFQVLGSLPSFIFMPLVPVIKKAVGKKNLFYIFLLASIIGYVMMYIISRLGVSKYLVLMYVAQFIKGSGFTVATGYMWALVPEVISYGEYKTGRRIAGIVNALTGMFFKAGMALGGAVPGWVMGATGYVAKPEGASTLPPNSGAWFTTMVIYALCGLALLIFCFTQTKERVVMEGKETENVKYTDLFVEFVRNRPLRVLAYFFITAFTTMFVHNSTAAYVMDDYLYEQTPLAQEGVRWCVSVIPSILLVVCIVIIYFYELTDDKVDEINKAIEARQTAKSDEEQN